jgi:hypothetical protein
MYDYIRRSYHVTPIVGQRVRHTELRDNNEGKIAPEDFGQSHYVMVSFPGRHGGAAVPCHPTALEYLDHVA